MLGGLKLTQNFKKIDQREEKRIDNILQIYKSGKGVDAIQILNSEEIPKILEQGPLAHWHSFRAANPTLPLNCLLFPTTLVEICAGCDCNSKPELLKPYLERGLILPILTLPYEYYNPLFLDLIMKYPHIGFYSYWLFRYVKSTSITNKKDSIHCPNCFDEECKNLLLKISKGSMTKLQKDKITRLLSNVVFPQLQPPRDQDLEIFNQIQTAVNQGKFDLLKNIASEVSLVNGLRTANNFSAIPQIDQHDLENAIRILGDLDISMPESVTEEIQNKEWTLNALDLNYNPEMPIEEYLDIIIPRKNKINSLLSEMVSSGSESRQLNDEVWKINQEISSSKSLEVITFLTNFISGNSSILFGMLSGAMIGYFSGNFVGCGLGSIGGIATGFAGKVASKYTKFKIPKYPKKTIEWVKARIEGPEYDILSTILSKETKIIQVWSLKEKLKKG